MSETIPATPSAGGGVKNGCVQNETSKRMRYYINCGLRDLSTFKLPGGILDSAVGMGALQGV